jgi:23S rRNA pseudouridine1911/1915/1917 synthase
MRLDAYLAAQVDGWSRSRLQQLIDNEDVLVNSRGAKPSYKVRPGDEIEVELAEIPPTLFEPENIPLDIVLNPPAWSFTREPVFLVALWRML